MLCHHPYAPVELGLRVDGASLSLLFAFNSLRLLPQLHFLGVFGHCQLTVDLLSVDNVALVGTQEHALVELVATADEGEFDEAEAA